MYLIIEMSIVLLLSILMTGVYFIIQRIRGSELVVAFKVNNSLGEFILGIIWSGFFITFQITGHSISSSFQLQFFVVGFLALFIVVNYRVAAYSLPLSLIYLLFQEQIGIQTYILIIGMFSVAVIHETATFFSNAKVARYVAIITSAITGVVTLMISLFVYNNNFSEYEVSFVLLPFIASIITIPILSYARDFSISANLLYESINFTFSKYYRETLRDEAIGEYIKQNKTERGIYGLFEIRLNGNSTPQEIKKITEKILLNIEERFPSDVILFKASNDNYGFFFGTQAKLEPLKSINGNSQKERDSLDPLVMINKVMDYASIKYFSQTGDTINAQLFSGISFYGTQDSALEKLNDNAIFALKINSQQKTNRTNIFDPKIYRSKVNDSYLVLAIDKSIELDRFSNMFVPIYNIKTDKTDMFYVHKYDISETQFIEEVRDYVYSTGMIDVFDRYFATNALSKVKKERIAFHYPFSIFGSNFNKSELLRQLNSFNVMPSQIIFIASFISKISTADWKIINKNIKDLRSHGFAFGVQGKQPINFKPDYVFINAKNIKNKINQNEVIIDVQTEEQIGQVIDEGFNMLGGRIFQNNVNLINFNKQSKIYLEKIISNKEKNE